VIADAGNIRPGVPTLTVAVRGDAEVLVAVTTLPAAKHSGDFGGAAPDALLVLLHALATLHDARGDVAVAGLRREPWVGVAYDEAEFRRLAGVPPAVPLLGSGTLGERLWSGPAITVIGIDAPPVEQAVNAVVPHARAKLNLRIHPEQDAAEAQEALIGHLAAVRPFGIAVSARAANPVGDGFAARTTGPAYAGARAALRTAWGGEPVIAACGGAIPLASALHNAVPDAEVLLFGAQDSDCNLHAPNERVLLRELERAVLAQAAFLHEYAVRWEDQPRAARPSPRRPPSTRRLRPSNRRPSRRPTAAFASPAPSPSWRSSPWPSGSSRSSSRRASTASRTAPRSRGRITRSRPPRASAARSPTWRCRRSTASTASRTAGRAPSRPITSARCSAGPRLGHKESIADTARVLGRMYDAIEFRGAAQADVEKLAAHAGVPVYNGLTDDWHPTQMLADFLTMTEAIRKPCDAIAYAFVGDTRSNTARSLLVMGAIMGCDVRICGPEDLWPPDHVRQLARERAASSGASITLTADPGEALVGADFVYTDVWVSMGEPKDAWAQRVRLLAPYQVNRSAIDKTGNPRAKLLHCLPAFHDAKTIVGREIMQQTGMWDGLEVTDEVFQAPSSIVFDQAENRLHTIKAVLVATLGAG